MSWNRLCHNRHSVSQQGRYRAARAAKNQNHWILGVHKDGRTQEKVAENKNKGIRTRLSKQRWQHRRYHIFRRNSISTPEPWSKQDWNLSEDQRWDTLNWCHTMSIQCHAMPCNVNKMYQEYQEYLEYQVYQEYQEYQEDQDQISGATYISDVVFIFLWWSYISPTRQQRNIVTAMY